MKKTNNYFYLIFNTILKAYIGFEMMNFVLFKRIHVLFKNDYIEYVAKNKIIVSNTFSDFYSKSLYCD